MNKNQINSLGCIDNLWIYESNNKWFLKLDEKILEVGKDIILGTPKPNDEGGFTYPFTLH